MIRKLTGLTGKEKISSLSDAQFQELLRAIRRSEGWWEGTVTRTRATK